MHRRQRDDHVRRRPGLPPSSAAETRIDSDHDDRAQRRRRDTIHGEAGQDVLVGGSAGDRIDGEQDEDLIFGDNVQLDAGATGDATTRASGRCWRADLRLRRRPAPRRRARTATSATPERRTPTGRTSGSTTAPRRSRPGDPDDAAGLFVNRSCRLRRRLHRGRRGRRRDLRPARQRHDSGRRRSIDGARSPARRGRPAATGDPLGPLADRQRASSSCRPTATTTSRAAAATTSIFGNLGQDDIIGGSSDLYFGLSTPAKRPDGADLIFGGSGTRIAHGDIGDATRRRGRSTDRMGMRTTPT